MLPAAQLKMLRYMRSSEPKGSGSGTGNAPADNTQASGSPSKQPSPTRPSTQPPPQAMHAPLLLHTRQQLAEAAKIPIPSPSRGATPAHQTNDVPRTAYSPPKQQYQQEQPQRQGPFQRARSNSGDNENNQNGHPPPTHPDQQQQQIWEDSSINSMFAESVATTARPPPRVVNLGRYGNSFPQQRAQHQYERTAGDRGNEESIRPLPLGDKGVPRIPPTAANGDAAAHGDDPYAERLPYGSPAKHMPVLKHSKYALRDARGVTRRSSFTDRQPSGAFDGSSTGSPEQRVHQRGESSSRLAGPAAAGLGRPDQDIGNSRAALFRDVGAPLGRTPHRPEIDRSDMGSQSDEAPNQRTPRQNRPSPPGAAQQQPPPALPHKRVLQESSLPRVGSGGGGHRDRKQNRKRHHSPDYDDSMLHSMSYSELRDEPFDHDPARMAVQAPAVPANLSIEDRLGHFKTKEATSQRHFFTEMSMHEWDESGDWFLEQFAALSNKIREKRQAKRRKIAEFEAEITERENTVRHKAESIERTLGDLRNEGEGMMRNRVVDF
ncbi:hypothetical protein F503_02876 [Ophiostoma piceae UAMH 11346]|uniref:Extracellular mutant protein 11 C-terminal domain-containing protein n=1 Tax=Ophiostoma piceae (strain UAMH 11346) TaxID=1262450 RepID=S3BZU6_OPHP1|nr:hypothetical protein F503_02876 [Ophiostoma piceae UAMH 11346]